MPRPIAFALVSFAVLVFTYVYTARNTTPPYVNVPNKAHIGVSHQMRPITAYTFGDGPIHLLLVGGIHGGYEANTVQLGYRILHYLKYEVVLPDAFSITVIPTANPDGMHKIFGHTGAPLFIPQDANERAAGRFNAQEVDLNRNFDCAWQSTSTWGTRTVSAGTHPFSEQEAQAIRDVVHMHSPKAAIFFHSKADGVYASSCNSSALEETLALMRAYADASGYPAYESFDAYPITGDAEGYLASLGIPAITVELATHEDMEWEQNQEGLKAVIKHLEEAL